MKYTLLLLAVLLSSCASVPDDEPVIADPTREVNIDPKALQACKPLQPLGAATFESLLETHKENTIIYYDCKAKQDTSIKLLKEFANQ